MERRRRRARRTSRRILAIRSKRGMRRRQRHGKISDPMRAGQQAGQNAGVRSVGKRAGSKCLGEPDSIVSERVQSWRFNLSVSVAMHVVGSKRVHRDQENVGRVGLFCRSLRERGEHRKKTDQQGMEGLHGSSD